MLRRKRWVLARKEGVQESLGRENMSKSLKANRGQATGTGAGERGWIGTRWKERVAHEKSRWESLDAIVICLSFENHHETLNVLMREWLNCIGTDNMITLIAVRVWLGWQEHMQGEQLGVLLQSFIQVMNDRSLDKDAEKTPERSGQILK